LNNSLIVDNEIIIQKTILIFGKTGAGKSSILNSITNSSSKIFPEGESNSSETQEIKAVIHKLFNNGVNCLFIDSPGLFDSGKKDKENMKKMSKYIQKSGYSIIIFAYSILEPKIDQSFYITLEMLTEIFGESVMSRVYFVLTHLNDLNPNKKESKINLIKSDFNKLVKNNKNELLYYENSSNNNYGLSQLENIL
jgi:predicted GTPase